jgi:hypothetical protein
VRFTSLDPSALEFSLEFALESHRMPRRLTAILHSATMHLKSGCKTMRVMTLAVATAFILGTATMTTAGMAFGNHGGWGGNQGAFAHPFHKRGRFHKTFIVPYAYYDYDYPADAFGDTAVMAYPPPAAPPASSTSACHRNVEKFTVPSKEGGTRQITIINCP